MPIDQNLRRLRTKLQNLVMLALVDRAGKRYQILGAGDQARPDVAYMQPQGLHFRAPAQAKGVVLCPAATPENAVLINAQGSTPADILAEGEGGLHYLGTFKVFVDKDGLVHLGSGDNPSDEQFLALADKLRDAVAAMLDAGSAAGGPGAANFGAAKTKWISGTPDVAFAAATVKGF